MDKIVQLNQYEKSNFSHRFTLFSHMASNADNEARTFIIFFLNNIERINIKTNELIIIFSK